MQFTRNGPDVPERLLQEHEEGRVVFFCGAGISCPAGLPGFEGLVETLHVNLEISPDPTQEATLRAKRYDHAITWLDARPSVGRTAVRKEIARILQPEPSGSNATQVHQDLLILGSDQAGRTRLVTTNFDRLFEHVIGVRGFSTKRHTAPFLPLPKTRWDGLGYLHGLLPDSPDGEGLEDLVVSSGDFGLAYLTERWAARFVSALLQRFTVCFVGYSLEDPVLRYMMDALAADRLRGEVPREMFAFGSHSKGQAAARAAEWKARNATPILYREYRKHYFLRETLHQWAGTYRDGLRGKSAIVVRHAAMSPNSVLRDDADVRRMLWALSDPSGAPARKFATMDPVPSLAWLGPLNDPCFGHTDLIRFEVPPKAKPDDALHFSLLHRPAPYDLAPRMALVDWEAPAGELDTVLDALGVWLIRHLNNADLFLWLITRGGRLHPKFALRIRRRITELAKLEREGKSRELAEIKDGAPDAIPGPAMRTLWGLFLSGRVKLGTNSRLDLYDWMEDLEREGLTPVLRMKLRDLLRPCVVVRKPYRWSSDTESEPEASPAIRDLVDTSLDLVTDHARHILEEHRNTEAWTAALPTLLEDATGLLRDALDLKRMLGDADDRKDWSYITQPSISDHEQNSDVRDWTVLIDLARDAWRATTRQSPDRARRVAEGWSQTPYPLFRRLAFFAAAQEGIVPSGQGLHWLLADEGWWLWSTETHRESLQLVTALAPRLAADERAALQAEILKGPPHSLYKPDLIDERWAEIVDRQVWLRLKKIAQTGAPTDTAPQCRLDELTAQHPDWQLSDDQREEFLVWSGDPEDLRCPHIVVPRDPDTLTEWLRAESEPVDDWGMGSDGWQECCREDPKAVATALLAVAEEGMWPAARWREAFYQWSRDDLQEATWRQVSSSLVDMPPAALSVVARGMSSWLEKLARVIGEDDTATYLALCDRILGIDCEETEEGAEPLTQAINHPMGCITTALLHRWYASEPTDRAELTEEARQRFASLCDPDVCKERHGRVVLARHVISLFRVDPEWTEQHLLPLFSWSRSAPEAVGMWQAFLHAPRLHPPLLAAFKSDFLATGAHFQQLGRCGRQYATFLTFVALDSLDTEAIFSRSELADALAALPPDGLGVAARALFRAVESAGDQRAEYWANRATPFLRSIWPQTTDVGSAEVADRIAESFAQACVAAADAFPVALDQVRAWLRPLTWGFDRIARDLLATDPDLIQHHPEKVLELLHRIVGERLQVSSRLAQCLNKIELAQPDLASDRRFQRLGSLVHNR